MEYNICECYDRSKLQVFDTMTQFRSIIVFRHWVGSEYEGRGRNGLCYNGRPRATVWVRGMCTKHQEPRVSRQGRLRKSETSTFYTKPEYI